MKIISKTSNNKFVVDGVYYLYNTYGIPLEYICLVLAENNYIINWLNLITDATDVGMKQSNIISKIRTITLDVYGKDFSNQIIKRINLCLKNK